jgi:biopolymer transport protein TolR
MKLSALQKRAHRQARQDARMDMNLVALIDVFTILLFFLLSSAGTDTLEPPAGLRLPLAQAETPASPTVVLSISGTDIHLQGQRVAGVAEVLASGDTLIAPLQAQLAQLAADSPVLPATADGRPAPRAITILGDQHIPYALLRKVMATCAQAQFADVSFAVQRRAV